jgi:putative endonuclease
MDQRFVSHRRETGQRAERICELELRRRGWSILARNWRIRIGEIDLIARDGRTVVIVEVKSGRPGRGAGPVRPVLAVNAAKQRRLRRLASAWLSVRTAQLNFDEVRFDVVGVSFDGDGSVAGYEHIERAF